MLLQAGLALAGGLIAGYASCVEPHWIELTRLELPLARLPPAFDGITLAHISDIHFGSLATAPLLRRAVRTINELNADMVAVTGDILHKDPRAAETCARELSALSAPLGVYLVPGNHERYYMPEGGGVPYRRAGLVWLSNSARPVIRDGASLWVVGVDDLLRGRGDIHLALRGVPADACKIVLVHEPDLADLIARHGVDLQLSGHTHGGQVCLPGGKPIILPNLGRRYPIGLYRVNGMWLYTTRGLGSASFPLRLNCRPEIVFFTLRSRQLSSGTVDGESRASPW